MGVTILVRHGQASYGATSYDVLSELGHRQAARFGVALAETGDAPAVIRTGTLQRQRGTAQGIAAAFSDGIPVEADERWNEFDLSGIVGGAMDQFGVVSSARFQDVLDEGVRMWVEGEGASRGESHREFAERVDGALADTLDASRGGPQVVVTSAGVISWIATSLLGGGVEQWLRLNRVVVNTSATRIVRGGRGTSLISFNEHGHLPREQITYR